MVTKLSSILITNKFSVFINDTFFKSKYPRSVAKVEKSVFLLKYLQNYPIGVMEVNFILQLELDRPEALTIFGRFMLTS